MSATAKAVAAALITLPPALIVAVWALRRAATAVPVGDEHEYADGLAGPAAPAPFCRMPAYGWIVRSCGSAASARTIGAIAAAIACSATSAAAVMASETWLALLPIAVLVLSAERALLSARLWPDPLLASLHAALVLLLVVPDGVWVVPAAAVICTAITLFRLDGLPIAIVIALCIGGTEWTSILVVAAPVAGVGLLGYRARRRGHPLDTTTWFNLRLMSRRLDHGDEALERSIDAVMSEWEQETNEQRRAGAGAAARAAAHRPLRLLAGFLSRLLGLAGADTFGRHRLAPSYRPRLSTSAQASMSWGVPVLVAVAAAGAAVAPASLVAYVAAQWCLLAAVHTRSRYRAVLLPSLAVLAALGLDALIDGTTRAWIALGVGLLMATLARRIDLEAGSIQRAAQPVAS